MAQSATKHKILSLTVHVSLALSVLALGTPAPVRDSPSHQSIVLLYPVTQQKRAVPTRHVAPPVSVHSKSLGSRARSLTIHYASQPKLAPAQSLTPPALESQLPFSGGEGTSGTVGLDTAGSADGRQFSSSPCRAQVDPVEISFKPKPAYSYEARALHLEGEVLLQVVFLASRDIRFVRVTRSLGHGLDEAAVEAAKQIRFKPASCAGVPMDISATVHVNFRLSRQPPA
jgi:TonB family protein